MNFYAYVENSPVDRRDPSGKKLLGISGGITLPFSPGVVAGEFTLSGSLVIDDNFDIDVVVTPEVGIGAGSTGMIPGSAFLRGVASLDPDVKVESLKGFALSVTADALLLSGSATRTVDGTVFEGGFTTPSIAISGSGGIGFSAADTLGSAIGLFSSDSGLNPGVGSVAEPGAGGGFVLYPSRANLNGVRQVYEK